MLLNDYLKDLTQGELASVNLGHNDETGATSNNYPHLVSFINRGITALYTRFKIRNNYKEIVAVPGEKQYEVVLSEDDQSLGINSVYAYDKVVEDFVLLDVKPMTINSFELKHTYEKPTILRVEYSTAPKRLEAGCNTDQTVDLPHGLVNALTYFVLAKVHASKMDQTSAHKAIHYDNMYQRTCHEIEHYGLDISQATHSNKFTNNGWV